MVLRVLLLLITVATSNSLFASCSFGAEFLYWTPSQSRDSVDFRPYGEISYQGDYEMSYTPFDWTPGVRAYAGWDNLPGGWNIWASYTYLSSSIDLYYYPPRDQDMEYLNLGQGAGLQIFGTTNITQFLHSQKAKIQSLDLLFSRGGFQAERFSLTPYFGVTGVKIEQRFESIPVEEDYYYVAYNAWGENKALGLKLGADLNYPLCSGLDFFVKSSYSLLYGIRQRHSWAFGRLEENPDVHFFVYRKGHAFLQGVDLLFGVGSTFCLFDREINLHAGWQFLQWHNVAQINRMNFFAEDTLTLGFQGLVLGATFTL